MYNYQEKSTTTFKNQRWYGIDGDVYYPSITTVLGATMTAEKAASLRNWRNSIGSTKADKITDEAARRGSAVHLMIEQFLKDEPIAAPGAISSDIEIFTALKPKLKKVDEVYGQEVALWSDMLGVAGRCDCIGVYEGIPSIIDFKTSSRIKSQKDVEDYWLQIAFYLISHNEMFGTYIDNMVILMGVQGGTSMVFKKKIDEATINSLLERIASFYQSMSVKV
jgi:hypothetical protein